MLSFFRIKKRKNLLIQTAKIGDYVNSSVIFDKIKPFDAVIDKINYTFATSDERIKHIYIIQDYKKGIFNKLRLAFTLFWNNYKNIYVLMPNSFNLFLAKFSFSKVTTIETYANKWYEKLLMLDMKKIPHTKEDLTLSTYLKMVGESDLEKNWKSIPCPAPEKDLITSNKFKVGISLSAGNKIKTIDEETWRKIFKILSNFDAEIYFFGLDDEVCYLEKVEKYIENPYHSLLGKIELKYLPWYISKMNLYISSDTGNSYIADTFKVPSINFAGPCYVQKEQKPIHKNSLVVRSNNVHTPFSFVFKTAFSTQYDDLYKVSDKQVEEIFSFISMIYKSS